MGVINLVGAMPFEDFSESLQGIDFVHRISFQFPINLIALSMYAINKFSTIASQVFMESMIGNIFDQQIIANYPEIRMKYAESFKEAFNNDRIIGVRDDLRLLISSKHWGDFELKQICNEFNNFQQIPVFSIYGLNDTSVPPSHGYFLDNYFNDVKMELKKIDKGIMFEQITYNLCECVFLQLT